MNFCPHCGHSLSTASATPAAAPVRETPKDLPRSASKQDREALERLRPKVVALIGTIDDMSEDDFGDWVDALPRDEFLVWIALGVEGLRALAQEQAHQTTSN